MGSVFWIRFYFKTQVRKSHMEVILKLAVALLWYKKPHA
jgi:hypothetical protein